MKYQEPIGLSSYIWDCLHPLQKIHIFNWDTTTYFKGTAMDFISQNNGHDSGWVAFVGTDSEHMPDILIIKRGAKYE